MPPHQTVFHPVGGRLRSCDVCVKRDVDEFSVRSGPDLVPQTGGWGQAGQGKGRDPRSCCWSICPSLFLCCVLPFLAAPEMVGLFSPAVAQSKAVSTAELWGLGGSTSFLDP